MWHIFLADVFESFRNMCLKECELDPAHFLSTQGLAWQAYLKKTKIESELLTDIDMLLMVKKGTRGGICQAIHRQAKANNKYMKNYNKDVISSYLMYLDSNNLHGWGMSQKLPVNGFKWVKRLSRFNKIFIKNYNENSDIGYFLEVDFDYWKNCLIFIKSTIFTRFLLLICGIEDKEKYVILIRSLKQALNDGLVLRKVHRLIQFNQED